MGLVCRDSCACRSRNFYVDVVHQSRLKASLHLSWSSESRGPRSLVTPVGPVISNWFWPMLSVGSMCGGAVVTQG